MLTGHLHLAKRGCSLRNARSQRGSIRVCCHLCCCVPVASMLTNAGTVGLDTSRQDSTKAQAWSTASSQSPPSVVGRRSTLENISEDSAPSVSGGKGDAMPSNPAAEAGGTPTLPNFPPSELQKITSTQRPHAASVRMSVNNCHMLQHRASTVVESAKQSRRSVDLVASPSSKPGLHQQPPAVTFQKGVLSKRTATFRSAKSSSNKVQPALVTITAGETLSSQIFILTCTCNSDLLLGCKILLSLSL